MWYEEAVFYQVFPLGFCDGLRDNDGVMNRCISEFADWIPHLQKLGTDALLVRLLENRLQENQAYLCG